MAQKLQRIKEACDKQKTHKYEIQCSPSPWGFKARFFINKVVVATAEAKRKKQARADAGEQAFEELIKYDFEIATALGHKYKILDYQQALANFVEENGFGKVIYQEVASSENYFLIECKSSEHRGRGMGTTIYKARTSAAYHLLELLKTTVPPKSPQARPQPQSLIKAEQETQMVPIQDLHNLAFLLARDLVIGNESYDFFFKVIKILEAQNLELVPMGGYSTQSVRALRPELDLLVFLTQERDALEQVTLKSLEKMQFAYERTSYGLQVIFQEKAVLSNKIKSKSNENLICNIFFREKNARLPTYHFNLVTSLNPIFQQQLYSFYALLLIQQWREDAGLRTLLPIEILDFIVISITSGLKNITSPFQVLCQVIYLLKIGILQEIQEYPIKDLNPFLQGLPDVYHQQVVEMGTKVDHIRNKAIDWNSTALSRWLNTYQ